MARAICVATSHCRARRNERLSVPDRESERSTAYDWMRDATKLGSTPNASSAKSSDPDRCREWCAQGAERVDPWQLRRRGGAHEPQCGDGGQKAERSTEQTQVSRSRPRTAARRRPTAPRSRA